MAHPGGRPLAYKTADELKTAIDLYFATDERPTLAGLALALDISRSTLYLYDDKEQFSDIIKKARERVEARYEARLIYDNQPTGVIFALKNMGWKDKTEQDLNLQGQLGVVWNEQKTYETKLDPVIENKSL